MKLERDCYPNTEHTHIYTVVWILVWEKNIIYEGVWKVIMIESAKAI